MVVEDAPLTVKVFAVAYRFPVLPTSGAR